jgi:phosphatidylserine decarboxylase
MSFKAILLLCIAIYSWYEYENSQAKTCYRWSITRQGSRVFTKMSYMWIPALFRKPLYSLFASKYGVNLTEMENPDLSSYTSFSKFFTRHLTPKVRPIEDPIDTNSLCSPCDGTVLSFGEITDNQMKGAVKERNYPFDEFLLGMKRKEGGFTEKLIEDVHSRGNKLLFTIIYLGPGDYHRFHSPTSFQTHFRRHIAGWLEPVKPAYVYEHKDVFKDNERVNLLGTWEKGFFSISFVGALNVGSVQLHYDPALETNKVNPNYFDDIVYQNPDTVSEHPKYLKMLEGYKSEYDIHEDLSGSKPFSFEKGEEIGMFNFGSTIVLSFECPKEF